MDISKASNFERFIFDLVGRDPARVRELFEEGVGRRGAFTLTAQECERVTDFGFVSGTSSHADRLMTIADTHRRFGTVIDPHTADGLKVAREHVDAGVPMIVLETALPAKFSATIHEAIGVEPPRPPGLDGLEALPRRFEVMEADCAAVKRCIEAHAA